MTQQEAYQILADGFKQGYLQNIELIKTLEDVYLDGKTWPETKKITEECLNILYKMRDNNERKTQRNRALYQKSKTSI